MTGIYMIFPLDSYERKVELHKLSINSCNKICKDLCYDISWKSCEIITIAQIFYKKQILQNFHYITDNYFRDRNEVILIKNGEEINKFKTWELFEINKDDINYDSLLYTKYNDDEDKKNYTLIRDNNLKHPQELLTHVCDVNFIIFQLTNGNNKYDINLKDPYNFLIKDNILKYAFFKWYIKKLYDDDLTEDFSVNYMTQDMSIATLHYPFFIKFNEDSITSFSSGKPKLEPKPEHNIEQSSTYYDIINEVDDTNDNMDTNECENRYDYHNNAICSLC